MDAVPANPYVMIHVDLVTNAALATADIPAGHPIKSDGDYFTGVVAFTVAALRAVLLGAGIPHSPALGKAGLVDLVRRLAAMNSTPLLSSQGSRLAMAAMFVPAVEASDSPLVLCRSLERQ